MGYQKYTSLIDYVPTALHSLRHLSIQFPVNAGKSEILQFVTQCGGSLIDLCFDLPWLPKTVPEHPWYRLPTSPLAGLSGDIVHLCPNLVKLKLHDPQAQFQTCSQLPCLRKLRVSLQTWEEFTEEFSKSPIPTLSELKINIPDSQYVPHFMTYIAIREEQERLRGLKMRVHSRFIHSSLVSLRIQETLRCLPEPAFAVRFT